MTKRKKATIANNTDRRAIEFKRDKDSNRRERGWRRAEATDWYENNEWSDSERVVARGERERRRNPLASVASDVVAVDEASEAGRNGRVVAQNSGFYQVMFDDGSQITCRLRGLLSGAATTSTAVAVGDLVTVKEGTDGTGSIVAVAPRESSLSRPDPFHAHREHIIVANIEQLVIVQAVRDPLFWHEMVDRYLVAAAHWGVKPLLVINKVDLATPQELDELLGLYQEQLEVPTLLTSVKQNRGIDELRDRLAGHMSSVAGLSGVGKSSLLRLVEPTLDLAVSDVSESRLEGRHTTTAITLHRLGVGGYVADTPGVRNFGLWGIEPQEIAAHFADMRPLLGRCRFRDCMHRSEVGCAVRSAVEAGTIAESRYNSYLRMLEEDQGGEWW